MSGGYASWEAPVVERAIAPPAELRGEEEVQPEPTPEWPLKMPPDHYLKLHPEGAKAELARRILGP